MRITGALARSSVRFQGVQGVQDPRFQAVRAAQDTQVVQQDAQHLHDMHEGDLEKEQTEHHMQQQREEDRDAHAVRSQMYIAAVGAAALRIRPHVRLFA